MSEPRRLGRRLMLACPLIVSVALLAGGGCGAKSPDQEIKSIIKSINDSNGKRLANFYSMYQQRHDFKGPADATVFKKFIATVNPAQLDAMGVSAGGIEQLFVSERDGQPFDIRFAAARPPGTGGHQAVVFESKGSGGRVTVFMTGPKTVQVESAEVAAFKKGDRDELPGSGSPPPPLQAGRGS